MTEEKQFEALFNDGYSLRSLIDFLKSTVVNGNFIFKKKEIFFQRQDDTKKLLIELKIKTDDIGEYRFYDDPKKEIVFFMDLKKLRSITNAIGTNDSFKIWKFKDKHKLSVRNINIKKNIDINSIDEIIGGTEDYDIIDTSGIYSEEYNCSISSSVFSKMCKSMIQLGCSYVLCVVYPRGICFDARTDDGFMNKRQNFGICLDSDGNKISNTDEASIYPEISDEINPHEVARVKIRSNIIKSLGRVNSFIGSNKGVIRVYATKNEPIRFETKVGSYADLTINIRGG